MKAVVFIIMAVVAAGLTVSAQVRPRKAPAIKSDQQRNGSAAKAAQSDDAPPPPAPVQSDEVINIDTNLVTTPVSVLDRDGRFLPGLKQKDFKIYENGVPQRITYFQSEEQPFTVVLMIDISPSTKYSIDDIHYAAVTFVNQLRPEDKVMVVAFDQKVRVLTEPTSSKQALYTAIYKSQFGSGTSLYDAVDSVANLDLMNVSGRKAVVLFTDGVDTTSRQANFESTVASVEEIDALFYPIRYNTQAKADATAQNLDPAVAAIVARGTSPAEYTKGRQYLDTLSTNSGGRLFDAENITNLETSFAGVAEELRRQYSVGYYPDDTGKPGDRRKIKIEVARPTAIVRSKTSYVIKKDEPTAPNPTGN